MAASRCSGTKGVNKWECGALVGEPRARADQHPRVLCHLGPCCDRHRVTPTTRRFPGGTGGRRGQPCLRWRRRKKGRVRTGPRTLCPLRLDGPFSGTYRKSNGVVRIVVKAAVSLGILGRNLALSSERGRDHQQLGARLVSLSLRMPRSWVTAASFPRAGLPSLLRPEADLEGRGASPSEGFSNPRGCAGAETAFNTQGAVRTRRLELPVSSAGTCFRSFSAALYTEMGRLSAVVPATACRPHSDKDLGFSWDCSPPTPRGT